jgi:N-acetylated-alpha-linked acidic dipeptidase
VGKYLKEVTKLANDMREETETKNARIKDRVYELASDPLDRMVVPQALEPVPTIEFSPLQTALTRLEKVSKAYDSTAAVVLGSSKLKPGTLKSLDQTLIRTERALTSEAGLPRRSWFRHQIYAPGYYTGYGVKTLPGVREAIEQRNWAETKTEIEVIAKVLDAASAEIEKATKEIGSAK